MKIHSPPVHEHGEVPLADDGRLEAVTETWSPDVPSLPRSDGALAYVVSVGDWRSETHRSAQLAEILGLVEANGDTVVGHESLRLRAPSPRTWLGAGTCAEVAARAREAGASLLVIDAQLSPSQTRNLEDATGLSVSDREIVILGVFLRHARTRAARIQIELAHLTWLRPRIRGLGLDMDQQAGGVMAGKGAGETASELLARQLDDRLVVLRREAARLERAGEVRRRRRDAVSRVALVGYTNAGKTSLMNALTDAELSARARPFETLDTTSRTLTRHGGAVVLSDTVGFIRELPERLLASFATTLAEAREASLLAVVVDLSDPEWPLHLETTGEQLERIGAGSIPRIVVFNKADLLDERPPDDVLTRAAGASPWRVVSSHDPDDVGHLRDTLVALSRRESHTRLTLFVPYAATELSADVYRTCAVLETVATDDGVHLTVEGPAVAVEKLVQRSAEAACLLR